MSFDYVNRYYGVQAKRGGRVEYQGKFGTITSATHYVHVRLDGEKFARPYHPTDLHYLAAERETRT